MSTINKTKSAQFPEFVWGDCSQVIYSRLYYFQISSNEIEEGTFLAMERLQVGLPAMLMQAGDPPWIVTHSVGFPPIAFKSEEVLELFYSPPYNVDKFIPLAYDKNKGWLFYFRPKEMFCDSQHLVWCPEKLRNVPEINMHLEKQLEDDVLLDEHRLMKKIPSIEGVTIKDVKVSDNQWVRYRVKMWKDNHILPGQFVSFGFGAAIHLLRIAKMCGCSIKEAWGIMYSGVIIK